MGLFVATLIVRYDNNNNNHDDEDSDGNNDDHGDYNTLAGIIRIPVFKKQSNIFLLQASLPPYMESPVRILHFHFALLKASYSVTYATTLIPSLTQSIHRLLGLSLLASATNRRVHCPTRSQSLRSSCPFQV